MSMCVWLSLEKNGAMGARLGNKTRAQFAAIIMTLEILGPRPGARVNRPRRQQETPLQIRQATACFEARMLRINFQAQHFDNHEFESFAQVE